jgi:hypothetical protein
MNHGFPLFPFFIRQFPWFLRAPAGYSENLKYPYTILYRREGKKSRFFENFFKKIQKKFFFRAGPLFQPIILCCFLPYIDIQYIIYLFNTIMRYLIPFLLHFAFDVIFRNSNYGTAGRLKPPAAASSGLAQPYFPGFPLSAFSTSLTLG